MQPQPCQLYDLVDMGDPRAVFSEVRLLASEIHPAMDTGKLTELFEDILSLFEGGYPGYRGCNTDYHDLKHTTDNFLALMRLIHGAHASGIFLSEKSILLGLSASLLHDVGYLQEKHDDQGTGAKHTHEHVTRSIEFGRVYMGERGYPAADSVAVTRIIECTELKVPVKTLAFPSEEIGLIGRIQGTADLLGQMADRTYLEKLLLLFLEFREGGVPGYENEFDVLKKTIGFYELVRRRFADDLGGVEQYMVFHFRKRWNLDKDLYRITIENNMAYLKSLVAHHPADYRDFLRRGDIVKKLIEKELAARRAGIAGA